MDVRVLGIETSCDETGLALYDSEHGLLAQRLHSQVALHRDYGGVVPELAARDHIRHLLPLLSDLLGDVDGRTPDAVAYTQGPGLAGALMVGAMAGRALAYAWQVPALGIHHLEGHLLMPLMSVSDLQAPFLSLLVSGGHTQLLRQQITIALLIDLGVGQQLTIAIELRLGLGESDAVGRRIDERQQLSGLHLVAFMKEERLQGLCLEHGMDGDVLLGGHRSRLAEGGDKVLRRQGEYMHGGERRRMARRWRLAMCLLEPENGADGQ